MMLVMYVILWYVQGFLFPGYEYHTKGSLGGPGAGRTLEHMPLAVQ